MAALEPETKIKCVIWDLDDTLWTGSLAENHDISSKPDAIDLIRRLDEKGIINSVCSKNSYAPAKEKLEDLGIWNYFVFPVLDFVPKGQNVKQIIANLQLRPENVLFVDDEIGNRSEVEYYCKGVTVLDPHDPTFMLLMSGLIERTQGSSRLDQYKLLESKSIGHAHYSNNEDFLRASKITACVLRNPADLVFRSRIFELANRSNQLNFTKSRFSSFEELDEYLTGQQSTQINHGVIFVYDNYGDYGLVGFYAFGENSRSPHLEHFYFSCRILNMGIEDAVYAALRKEWRISHLQQLESREDRTREHVRIIREPDDRIHRYLAAQASTPATYRTSILAGCTSGIIDHYLSSSMRPARFDLSVLPVYGKNIPKVESIIYTAYSDYVNRPWRISGGFSYKHFKENLAEFLKKHAQRKVYLLLASERSSRSPGWWAYLNLRRMLSRVRWSILDGQNRGRYRRCNRLVRQLAGDYSNVSVIETGSYVHERSEQHNPTHFDRIVIKRICDHIAFLESQSALVQECADTDPAVRLGQRAEATGA